MSNFLFMVEWPELQEPAGKAESLVHADPRAACFYARYAMERAVGWVYRFDPAMDQPGYDHSLNSVVFIAVMFVYRRWTSPATTTA
ncbi:type I restriction enzyme, R subunit [Geopseudomonas sagittaria]|uniref:Type I restriction enzyme, R subunit n=1 Tax=Geopseudomonas sagittaria TaxID=1135990 RepID=A0A1I5XGG1_9GAMM|nr:DUF4145 domain-containing protein [Pseudomonas sagittaria]MCM2329687.1 DUF4145 domain-containing protein [Pseudomonas sagittaria]SFQ31048.1 type I restriction enzyme, R subunit [Pseudomonas sagittaria]